MIRNELPHQKILFVCTHERGPYKRVCCHRNDEDGLRDKLKTMVKARKLKPYLGVSPSGCIDKRKEGLNPVVFPDNMCWSHVEEKVLGAIGDALEADLRQEAGETARLTPAASSRENGGAFLAPSPGVRSPSTIPR